MALNFRDIANKKLEEVERPKNPPVGNYLWKISKIPTIETLKGDEWDVVDVPLQCIAPSEDVDPDSLAAYGPLTKLMLRKRFMFNKLDQTAFDKTMFELRRFLEDHVKCATQDMGIMEALNASVGHQVMAEITWRADKTDPEIMHANVGRTAPVL